MLGYARNGTTLCPSDDERTPLRPSVGPRRGRPAVGRARAGRGGGAVMGRGVHLHCTGRGAVRVRQSFYVQLGPASGCGRRG